jgi:DNA polymerase-3 subunit alpha
MRLIEPYASNLNSATVVLNGRTFPVPCLVEDDEDGIRWFVTASQEIYAPTWAHASAAGAAGIIVPGELRIQAITAERFAEDREERRPNYVVPAGSWSLFDHVPTYTEVFSAPRGGLVIAPTSSSLTGFVHGHTHAEYSSLDGLSTVSEIVDQAVKHGQQAVALTDHGRVSGHPELQIVCDKAGIKPIFGIEAYFQDDRFARTSPENTKEQNYAIRYGYYHLILWAMNDEGLHNLWAMSTESFQDGHYDRKPRLDWDTLRRHSTGVMAASGCLRGPLSVPILNDDEEAARANLGKLLDIFGDRFYLEIQPNSLAEQEKVNRGLVSLAKDYGVPLMATVDSHYPRKEDHDAHEAWIAVQTNSDVNDEGDLFAINLDLYMQGEEDVRKGLAYLGSDVVDEAVRNTLDLVTRTDARIGGKPTPPVFSKKGGHDRDAERLLDLCLENWSKVVGKDADQAAYIERFEREFKLLRQKDFCGYFLMVSDYCRWAKQNGILVGPGRGSGGGSLVAYLCDITEIDPVEGDLPFERFMTEGRTSLPDFDCDFPASMKERMLGYLREKYGDDQVVQIGTHLRLKSKGIVKDLKRALMSTLVSSQQQALDDALRLDASSDVVYRLREELAAKKAEIEADMKKVSKIIDEAHSDKAGLGMAWDDLWVQFGDDLQPYREKYPEIFNMADRLQGRLKSYGKHAAGVVISTGRPLTDWLPMTSGEDDGKMVTQFDMGALENMGLVKFDILTIRTLDTVQMAVDLIREQRGVDVEIYSWKEEYSDPQVWEEVAAAKTLGIFQIETHAGTRLCQRMGPGSLSELCDMITLVRPGPMRSGLTETYLKRRAGLEPVSYPDPRMEQVLGPTWGCMIYQEQIMQACILLGGYTSDEADEVRKILGKKKIEKIGPAGQEFVSRAVANGMEREAASHLWDQMAEFAKYSFGKAHAYAYAVLAFWTAWLKFHYPVEFFTAALSTIDKDRIPEFIKELRRAGYTVLPPDINASGKGFRAESLAVRYGLDAINGIGEIAVDYLIEGQPYESFEAFDEYVTQKGTKANAAVQMTLAKIGALDSLEPRRKSLVKMLEARKTGEDTRCVFKNDEVVFSTRDLLTMRGQYETEEEFEEWRRMNVPPDFCTFDWSTEEAPVNARTGKKLKKKPLPKKCTKACRQYTPPEPMDLSGGDGFSDEEIRSIEHDLLGVFLSSSPFDRLDKDDRARLYGDAEALVEGEAGRLYTVAAILMGIRLTKTRANGDEMAFLTLDTEVSTVEAVCFPRKWAEIKTGMHEGQLCLVVLEKQEDDRGFIAQEYLPVH